MAELSRSSAAPTLPSMETGPFSTHGASMYGQILFQAIWTFWLRTRLQRAIGTWAMDVSTFCEHYGERDRCCMSLGMCTRGTDKAGCTSMDFSTPMMTPLLQTEGF